jgi:hypothetical protein
MRIALALCLTLGGLLLYGAMFRQPFTVVRPLTDHVAPGDRVSFTYSGALLVRLVIVAGSQPTPNDEEGFLMAIRITKAGGALGELTISPTDIVPFSSRSVTGNAYIVQRSCTEAALGKMQPGTKYGVEFTRAEGWAVGSRCVLLTVVRGYARMLLAETRE